MERVLIVSLSPAFQKVEVLPNFTENEVNRVLRHSEFASGKGINVARALNSVSHPNAVISQVGGCRKEEFIEFCRKESINLIPIDAGPSIRTCFTLINESGSTSTEIVEEAPDVDDKATEKLFDAFMGEIGNAGLLVITGTKPKGFSDDVFPMMIEECRRRGIITVIDLKGHDLEVSIGKAPTIIKPNLSEFTATFMGSGVPESSENLDCMESVVSVLREIYEKYGTSSVISRGEFDTWIYDRDGFSAVHSEKNIKAVNTIGCGDVLTAGLSHKLICGSTLRDAVSFGMRKATEKALMK